MPTAAPPSTPILPLDRRGVLAGIGLSAGLAAAAPLSAQGMGGFTHGVASGEPGARRALLWTRYVAAQDSLLRFEVSETIDFARVAAGGDATASPLRDHCVKAWAEGLDPDRWYYYRFVAPDGAVSEIGRTRTLPEGPCARWKMAVFSCSNLGFGWFNAYAHAAQANEFDCAVHLGDYLYEYKVNGYPAPDEAIAGRVPDPANELIALADYRLRYAAYRRDPDLRRLHQLYPMIVISDDHETANDSWQGGAENHDPSSEGPWDVRKAAAMQAWHEWLPVSDDPWQRYDIGDLASIFRLETRLTARTRPFDLAAIQGKAGQDPAAIRAALAAFRDGSWQDASREILGAQQQAWLASGLATSKAAGRSWQILAQQVIMGNLVASASLADALPPDAPAVVRRRILAGALAGAERVPYNMDSWDGYPAARGRLFRAALDADADLITLTGDSHNAWAFEHDLDGTRVGVEFAGASVTSPGVEHYLPGIPPADFARDTVANNRQLKWMDAARRGYMAVELTPQAATCTFRFVDARTRGAKGLVGEQRVLVLAGTRRLALA